MYLDFWRKDTNIKKFGVPLSNQLKSLIIQAVKGVYQTNARMSNDYGFFVLKAKTRQFCGIIVYLE